MPILIDGHNLIGKVPNIDLSDPDDEARLVMMLRRYTTKRPGRKIVVVFDGGVYGHPDNLNGYGVEAVFAKAPNNADNEIIRRIRAIKRRDAWRVVSSDRAIIGAARAHHIPVTSAEDFARILAKIHEPVVTLREKRNDRPLSPAEIEEWMRIFGLEEDEGEEFY